MFRKTMMLAMAAAVVAAFAVPATVAAAQWADGGVAITSPQQIQLTGQTKWSGGITGSIECQVTTSLTLEPGETGTVTQYDVDVDEAGSTITSKCTAGGALASCQLHSLQPTGLPWVVHNEGQRLNVTSGEIHYTLTGQFCPGQTATMTASNPAKNHLITWTADNAKSVSFFTENGQVPVDTAAGNATAGTSGKLTVLAPNAGTYGLE